MNNRLLLILIAFFFVTIACNRSIIKKYRVEDIEKEAQKGKNDTLINLIKGYPIEMINKELTDQVIQKVPNDNKGLDFFISVGQRIQNRKIFDILCHQYQLWISEFMQNKLHDPDIQNFYILAAIYNQKSDSLDNIFLKYYKFWNTNFMDLGKENGSSKSEFEMDKYWYCGKNLFFTALFLNHLGNKEFTEMKLDSLEKIAFKYRKRPIKFENVIPDSTRYGVAKKVELPYELDVIENIDFTKTPIIKEKYDSYSYKRDFKVTIISCGKKALVYIDGDFDYILYYIELIDKKNMIVQTLNEKSMWSIF
jgi:hypothetical protein